MPPRPNTNTYWVEPGRLLAGEYPGATDTAEAQRRLNLFLDHGIGVFIDLTMEGELNPYSEQLSQLAAMRNKTIRHLRFGIPDKGVPASRALMVEILAAMRAALNEDKAVFIHCWGGIGRTGTVVACYLAEQHNNSGLALAILAEHWQQMEKKDRRPHSPETEEQRAWVQAWLANDGVVTHKYIDGMPTPDSFN